MNMIISNGKKTEKSRIMKNGSKMVRSRRNIEETREICETAYWNLAKCVENWKEMIT